jgi:hypothetical protein
MVSPSASHLPVHVYGTECYGARSAQGFKGGRNQKLTKKQKRMEAMQKNKSPGVREECAGAVGCIPADWVSLFRLLYHSPLANLDTSYFKASAWMSLIYLASVPCVNKFCGYKRSILTQSTQEGLTERSQGNALAFPLPENDAIRVFGMPRNVLLDVSQPSMLVLS